MEEKRQLTEKFMLRLPDGMRDRIKAAAEKNGRSMNSEIVGTLEEKYPAEDWTAEDLLDFLSQIAEAKGIEKQIAGAEALNQILELYGVGLEAHLEDDSVILLRRGWENRLKK